jgi:hypothetical protein
MQTVPRRDVTAVLLTIGEETTGRARASILHQTLQPAEIVTVSGVTPFFRALREGVARVTTPFLLQVDADMVLDDTCLERLRGGMTAETGIAVGQLRDPLIGTIAGIKLFRRECFEEVSLRNTVAPDVDFYVDLGGKGWLTQHVLSYGPGDALHTFGDHLPDFTPAYTWATYTLLGCRNISRNNIPSLLWRYGALRRSRHPMARPARVALLAGVFLDEDRDVPKWEIVAEPELLEAVSVSSRGLRPHALPGSTTEWYELGRRLRRGGEVEVFHGLLTALDDLPAETAWRSEAAFCHGFCTPPAEAVEAASVEARLRPIRS